MGTGSREGSRFGQYELRRLLGVGGMGEVYEAYDTSKGRTVALKLLDLELARDPVYVERFRRESFAAARLQEPHVIPVHDWGDIDGVLYIDMRLVQGHDLKERLQEQGPLPPALAVTIVEQMAAALDAAHEAGLVHRDVKPANILLTKGPFAYLVDFGIAHSESDVQLTVTGSAVGSFAYMAPERFENVAATGAVDIYSLSCVLYECLTGRVPFPANSFLVAIRSHQMAPPPRPSAVSPALAGFDQVIARGMAKDPRQRHRTAGELAYAARAALAHVPQAGARMAPVGRPAPETAVTPVAEISAPQRHPQQLPQAGRPPQTQHLSQPHQLSQPQQLPPTRFEPLHTHPSAPLPIPPPLPQGGGGRRGGGMAPLLTGALGAAVVLLAGAIIAWLLLSGRDGGTTTTSTGPTTAPSAGSTAPTSTPDTSTGGTPPTTPVTTPQPVTTPPLVGTVAGSDGQGFTAGPRCNSTNPAVTIGRTGRSRFVVCQTGVGRFYYKGLAVSNGNGIELDDPVPTGNGGFTATNPKDGTEYRISSRALIIVQGGAVVSNEPMLEFAYR
ncbi:serine/threonine-protein kinase [Nocardia sp. NPDC052566]|uniref:serine/threonine-protein kinase n=1 Tax=Nocardia sp. NPDC052566 TaxID=3364330 RepID=UPI0037CB316E